MATNMQSPASAPVLPHGSPAFDPLVDMPEKLCDSEAIATGRTPYPTAEEILCAKAHVAELRAKNTAMLRRLKIMADVAAAVQAEGRRTLNENEEMLELVTTELGPQKHQIASEMRNQRRAWITLAQSDAEVSQMCEFVRNIQERNHFDLSATAEADKEKVSQQKSKASHRKRRGNRRQR